MKKIFCLLALFTCLFSTVCSASGNSSNTYQLTIPEGYTLARVGMLLEEKGICTADELLAAAQQGDYSGFPLIAAQRASNRCFDLEGYLYPDTYEFYSNETPDKILRTLLTNMEQKLTPELREAIARTGYTADEILTLASIIEKEAYGPQEMPNISAVLHNRLDAAMKLQCDVTIHYVEGAIKPFISGDVNRFNNDYNTYKCPGLPAGPICNPGISAIKAAVSPADSDALYFVTDKDKQYYYARTWEEHVKNINTTRESNDEATQEAASSQPQRPKLVNKGA